MAGAGIDSGLAFACRWVPLDDCPPLGEARSFGRKASEVDSGSMTRRLLPLLVFALALMLSTSVALYLTFKLRGWI